MFRESAPRLLNVRQGLILALSLSAAAGWASFALSRHLSAEMERQLRNQVADLQATGGQLLAETANTQASLAEMAQLRADLAAARSEINRLAQSREQAQVASPPVRPEAKGANLRFDETSNDVFRTEAIGEKTSKLQNDRAVSAKPPEQQPRKQQIAAVQTAAQGTQKPADKLQRGKEPTVVSKLDTAAMRQLTKAAEATVP
jgi:hypothetical protein